VTEQTMDRNRVIPPVVAVGLAVLMCGLVLMIGWTWARHTEAATAVLNDVVVSINDFYFDPPAITISPGTTIIWQNRGDVAHTVSITGVVSSGDIGPGEIFTHTFSTKGTFPYQCAYYPDMQASVTVVDANEVPVDLGVVAWHDQLVGAGEQIDYHVEYMNRDLSFGTSDGRLTVTLPSASILVASTMDGNPFPPTVHSGQMLVYNIGAIDPYDSRVIDLVVDLPGTLQVNDEVVLTASISAANPDPYPDNNYVEDSEAIPGANMMIFVRPASDSGPFVPGGVVTYSIEYYNQASYMDATSVIVAERLPTGVTFLSALNDDWYTVTPITPVVVGNELRFSLGTLPAGAGGQLLVQAQLSSALYAKTVLRTEVSVTTTSAETSYEDNWAFDEQSVLSVLPDLWVYLHSSTDGQIDGYQTYWLNLGNAGPQEAHSVAVTLSIPINLVELEFGALPDALITRTNDYLATWTYSALAADEGYGLSVSGRINAAGAVTATATITSSSPEADPTDNVAQVGDVNAEILMPIIDVPSTAIVGPQPVFYGLGQPNATVTLFLSGTLAVPGQALGQAIVDGYSRWVLTPTVSLTQPGWYWFTATQQLNGRVSPVTGVGNFVTDTQSLIMDTNSMVRYIGTRPDLAEGEPIGGINQPLGWRLGVTYTLGARLTRCDPYEAISPTLQVLFYNDGGLMVGHQDLAATYAVTLSGYVEFEFGTPEEETPFELFLHYYCPVPAPRAPDTAINALQPYGWWQDLKDWFSCWESLGCDKPDPPPPPKPGCQGCTPIPRPRPRPKPTDPDGYVYDCSMVRAGATMAQSIISQAWVTATQRGATGVYAPWNALEYDQVNPQYTGPLAIWPDKVSRLGYFSFLVPSGGYRLLATAPGYVPFQSQVLYVTNSPVTLNIPMRRPGDVADCTSSTHRVYVPIVMH